MPKQPTVARVLHVTASSQGAGKVVLITGDREIERLWAGSLPAPGEVFLLDGETHSVLRKLAAPLPGAWSHEGDGMRWRRRNAGGQTRMEALWKRHVIRRSVRDYLDGQGFIEIDCPLLVRGTTPDAVINSFRVGDRYLTTSTELQMRRMQVGGFDQLYTLTQNFREADGEGTTHNPEFTMLEWVRVGGTLPSVEEDTEQLTWQAHRELGGDKVLTWRGHTVNIEPPWERVKMADIISRLTGAPMPDFSLASIQAAIAAKNISVPKGWEKDRVYLFSILVDHLQEHIGFDRPVFIYDWPAFQTSSALEKEGSEITERSEAFICGLELCDGFLSLTDYEGQKATSRQQLERRKLEGKEEVALDQAYLDSLRLGLPQDAAMALGFDRLVMLLTDRADIRSVLALAWDEL